MSAMCDGGFAGAFMLGANWERIHSKVVMCVTNWLRVKTMRRDVFQAIADPNRRAILGLLANERLTLNGVAEKFRISRPAVSRHMKILAECGLVEIQRRGRERYCEARLDPMNEVTDWVKRYKDLWETRLDVLNRYPAQLHAKERRSSRKKRTNERR